MHSCSAFTVKTNTVAARAARNVGIIRRGKTDMTAGAVQHPPGVAFPTVSTVAPQFPRPQYGYGHKTEQKIKEYSR
jgi:hypothetical protein